MKRNYNSPSIRIDRIQDTDVISTSYGHQGSGKGDEEPWNEGGEL